MQDNVRIIILKLYVYLVFGLSDLCIIFWEKKISMTQKEKKIIVLATLKFFKRVAGTVTILKHKLAWRGDSLLYSKEKA